MLDDEELGVLLRLHDQIDEADEPMSASQIASSFKPPMSAYAAEAAIAKLVVRGFVITASVRPTATYKISRAGILEIEASHDISTTIDPSTRVVYRTYQAKQTPNQAGIHIHNNFSPTNNVTSNPPMDDGTGRSAARAGWFGAWAAWVAAAVALVTLGWILHEAKVF